MIHFLFGSHVQKLESGFFLIGRETILMIRCVLIGCHVSTRLPVRSWSEGNKMPERCEQQIFCCSYYVKNTLFAYPLRMSRQNVSEGLLA